MGRREATVKTYGRHRQRVISSEVWNQAVGRKETEKHVFSTSSSMDSLSFNVSHNSSEDSVFQPRKTRPKRNCTRNNKENQNRKLTKEQLKKLDVSGRSSTSSTGSEGLFTSKTRPHRPLRDCSNVKETRSYGKRKRASISALHHYSLCKNATASSGSSLYNFSEFDDYSLVISDTTDQNQTKNKSALSSPCSLRSGKKLQIETSTPLAKKFLPGTPLSEKIKNSDLSHIELVEDSPIATLDEEHNVSRGDQQHSCSELDRLGLSSVVNASPNMFSNFSPKGELNFDSTAKSCDSSPKESCLIQLEKLRESFLSMHVSRRNRSQHLDSNSVDNSKSLFTDTGVSDERDEEEKSAESCEQDDENSDESEFENGLSDIEEDLEDDENEESEENDDETSQSSDGSPNSTHFMLASSSYLQEIEEEEEELSIITVDQSDYCTANSDEESTGQSYHTAESSQNSLQITSDSIPRKKKHSLDTSVFDVLTPKKNTPLAVEDSPRTKVYQVCQQKSYVSFSTCIPDRMMKGCTKVGEGVYGEVFRTQNNGKSVALKVIPIEGSFPVNDEPQKTFSEMLPEIVISRELSSLRSWKKAFTPNFCQVNRVSCVKGKYPDKLLKEWDMYNEKCHSENDKPDMFDTQQLFIVFEFADGGRDVESCQFNNIFEAKSTLAQVAFSLAVAEETLEFEHRDLHWGNVLVKRTERPEIQYRLMGQDFSIPSYRVETCLIDFTLSRFKKEGSVVYNDLSKDETLFEGSGDLQFDIYRQMKENNGNNWEAFHPRTNVLWLHYLCDKLVRSKRYVRNSREDKTLLREFRSFLKDMLDYNSACDLVICSDFLKS